MIVTGYTNEYGTVIPMEDADDYIKKRIKGNEEDREWFIDYMWDVLENNMDELLKLREAFFDDVCSDKECDEQGNAIPYNGEYEPEGRQGGMEKDEVTFIIETSWYGNESTCTMEELQELLEEIICEVLKGKEKMLLQIQQQNFAKNYIGIFIFMKHYTIRHLEKS